MKKYQICDPHQIVGKVMMKLWKKGCLCPHSLMHNPKEHLIIFQIGNGSAWSYYQNCVPQDLTVYIKEPNHEEMGDIKQFCEVFPELEFCDIGNGDEIKGERKAIQDKMLKMTGCLHEVGKKEITNREGKPAHCFWSALFACLYGPDEHAFHPLKARVWIAAIYK